MRSHPLSLKLAVVLAVVGVAGGASAFTPEPIKKCRGAILRAATELLTVRAKVLAGCANRVNAGKLPAGACPDLKASSAIDKARIKLRSAIDRACGGRDKQCGRGTEPDVLLGDIGWNIVSCDHTGSTVCANPIADCGDVATCVQCVAEHAADRALELFANRPALNPPADKTLTKCLSTIGISSASSFVRVAKSLGECWRDVNDRGSGGSFSCPNRTTSIVAGKAKAATAAKICDRCGGANGKCGGGDDFAPAALGFAADCPAIGTCAGPVQTIRDLADCTGCVGHALMDAAVRRSIPAFSLPPPPCTP